MYTEAGREALREQLVSTARADPHIAAAAAVGSAARHRSDRWSDIDLAFRVIRHGDLGEIAGLWTDRMYAEFGAVDHFDVWAGTALYRVFLLRDSLQVDLSFWPFESFAATGEAFALLFGKANPPRSPGPAKRHDVLATGWLYILHARSSIGRGRLLQALHMIDHHRDQIGSLMCLRHGLSAEHGRGIDDLPPDLRRRLAATMVTASTAEELTRALSAAVTSLLDEAHHLDPKQAHLLQDPLQSSLLP